MATSQSLFTETVWMLGAAAIAAPIFKRLGLGTVLGYLAGGVIIGPVLQRISNGEEVLHVAELGIVFLLFMIGLELKPARLWTMRKDIFGLGLAQVAVTGAILVPLAYLGGVGNWSAAVIAGSGLALSSTAFAMQILDDNGDVNTRYGQRSFSMLLFQDIAIVPLLALVSILGGGVEEATTADMLTSAALALLVVALMVAAGRYVLTPVFQIIAATGAREVMIVAALFLVIGSAMAMQMVGLSMAMGAFLAGVMLAESSYRHELEADIEPFRGVFLSIFFIAVGLSLELQVVYDNLLLIVIAVPVLLAVKAAVIYGLCRVSGSGHDEAIRIAALLPQGGEFGFVMFSTAAAAGVLSNATASVLIAVVTLSMVATPLCVRLAERITTRQEGHEELEEDFDGADADVLMVGFSRFGQIAAQILLASGRDVTIIDYSAERIRQASAFGFHIYFGDGTRKEVLVAAGIEKAKIVAVCTQKREITDRVIDVVQENFPRAHIYARSYDRGHTLALRQRGVEYELRETLESGLVFGKETLIALGTSEDEATAITDDIRRRDAKRLEIQAVEGIMAGSDMLHTQPVSPEPLMRPKRNRIDPTVKVTGKDMA
ncbi:monovalent cation:proton antiporter-2 (CPA2) family protein [Martelella sp. AD-3]|uniref:monovalent cation:proton antiporter-2 (CPA2) family protein n=1 Tax=Martelella sp. AD-3 TaxID=686597 RepID=UPI000466C672|nr:monovalent cation:proton antiporter-2 (CPA2) family protein [Martelella sp. AD-3]AMM83621.1 potassium transporter TrkA [Martelella sp. AD-3]MAM11938.1 potassium transporter TrkA [Rhizobiaceae bacterium]